MKHPAAVPLLAVAAVLFWAWSIYGFVAGVLNGYGDGSGGNAGRLGAATGHPVSLTGAGGKVSDGNAFAKKAIEQGVAFVPGAPLPAGTERAVSYTLTTVGAEPARRSSASRRSTAGGTTATPTSLGA